MGKKIRESNVPAVSSRKGLFATLFAHPYTYNENLNFLRMLLVHIFELIVISTNVVVPVIVSNLAQANSSSKGDQGNSKSSGLNLSDQAPLLIAAGALLLTTILPKIRTILINSVRFNTQKNMVLDMTKGVYERDYDKTVGTPTGEYFAALTNNYHSVDRVMTTIVSDLVPVILETGGISGVLAYLFGWVGIFPAATLVLYLFTAFILEKSSTSLKKENAEAMSKVYVGLVEGTNNYQIAHQFGNVELELRKLNAVLSNLEASYNKVYGMQEKSGLLLSTIVRLSFIGALLYVFFLPPTAKFWSSDFMLFAYYLFRFSSITEPLPPKISELYKGYMDSRGIISFLNKGTSVPDPTRPVQLRLKSSPSIEFKHVNFNYPGDGGAGLNDVSFSIEPGQKLVIMGATGSGKSTMLKLIQRFFDYQGDILINGYNIKDLRKDALRALLSVVSLEVGLINDTIYNNIKYGDPKATKEDIKLAARFAGLTFDEKRFFDEAQKQGKNFSDGEKQRVLIARALLKPTSFIYLLDEPTSALDQTTAKEVMGVLDRLTKDGTTILITHDPSAAVNANLIVYIEKGKILEKGTYKELMARKGGFYNQVVVQCQKLGVAIQDVGIVANDTNSREYDEFHQWRESRRELRGGRMGFFDNSNIKSVNNDDDDDDDDSRNDREDRPLLEMAV